MFFVQSNEAKNQLHILTFRLPGVSDEASTGTADTKEADENDDKHRHDTCRGTGDHWHPVKHKQTRMTTSTATTPAAATAITSTL